jgi:hypothetical protein
VILGVRRERQLGLPFLKRKQRLQRISLEIFLDMLLLMLLAKLPEKFKPKIVSEEAPDNPGGNAQRKILGI